MTEPVSLGAIYTKDAQIQQALSAAAQRLTEGAATAAPVDQIISEMKTQGVSVVAKQEDNRTVLKRVLTD